MEKWKNGKMGYAFDSFEYNGIGLGIEPLPSIIEYNKLNQEVKDPWGDELYAEKISEYEFAAIWASVMKYIK